MERSRFSFYFSISAFFFLSFFFPFTLSFLTDKSGRQGRNWLFVIISLKVYKLLQFSCVNAVQLFDGVTLKHQEDILKLGLFQTMYSWLLFSQLRSSLLAEIGWLCHSDRFKLRHNNQCIMEVSVGQEPKCREKNPSVRRGLRSTRRFTFMIWVAINGLKLCGNISHSP